MFDLHYTLMSNTPICKQTDGEEEEDDDSPAHTRRKICTFSLHIIIFMTATECTSRMLE